MARIKLWLLPVYALAAFLGAVFLIPSVGWIPREHLDVLAGEWQGGMSFVGNAQPTLAPKVLGPTDSDPAADDDTVLLKLLIPQPREWEEGHSISAWDSRMSRLATFCEQKRTKEYLALFLRISSVATLTPRPNAELLTPTPTRSALRRRIVQICREGEGLDPVNAFFPLLEAGALYNLGDLSGSKEAFLRSSRGLSFDEYVELESDIRHRWLIKHHGYRGNQMDAWIAASLVFPNFASIRGISRFYSNGRDPADRVAALRVGDLLIRRSSTVIGILVGRSIIAVALQPGIDLAQSPLLDPPQAELAAKELQRKAGPGPDLSPMVRDYSSLQGGSFARFWDSRENLLESKRPAYGAALLAAMALFPFYIGWAYLRGKSERFSAAAPFLIWLLVGPLGGDGLGHLSWLWLGFGVLLGIPALFPKARGITIGLALAWSAAAAYFVPSALGLLVVVLLFLGALAMERWAKKPLWPLAALTIGAATTASAAAWTSYALSPAAPAHWTLGLAVLIGCAGFVQARSGTRWEPIAGVACLLLGLGYGVCLNQELAANRALVDVSQAWLQEANDVRSQSHIR